LKTKPVEIYLPAESRSNPDPTVCKELLHIGLKLPYLKHVIFKGTVIDTGLILRLHNKP